MKLYVELQESDLFFTEIEKHVALPLSVIVTLYIARVSKDTAVLLAACFHTQPACRALLVTNPIVVEKTASTFEYENSLQAYAEFMYDVPCEVIKTTCIDRCFISSSFVKR